MNTALAWLGALLLADPTLVGNLFEHPRSAAQARSVLVRAMPDAGRAEVLRGHYQQRKYLREIPRPLNSTGEFLLVRDRGIWWHTQTPLDAELTLPLNNPQQPGLESAAALLLALLVLDLEPLARNFDLYLLETAPRPVAPPAGRWQLGLRPRDAGLASLFEQVIVSGGQHVQHVTLYEATGDRTEITLESTSHPLSSLTLIERKRLEL